MRHRYHVRNGQRTGPGATGPAAAAEPAGAGVADWDGYAVRWAQLHGGADPRGLSAVPRGWLRMSYTAGRWVARAGLGPAAVTAGGLVVCLLVPVAAAGPRGWPLVAALLAVLAALADTLDGAVAVITGRASRLGYVFDSVIDRIGEAAWLLALWLIGVPAWLVLGCAGLVFLHEYLRARATAAGLSEVGVITVAERPTRVILTAAALVWFAVARWVAPDARIGWVGTDTGPAAAGATAVTGVWLLLGIAGLVQLTRMVTARLAHQPPPVSVPSGSSRERTPPPR